MVLFQQGTTSWSTSYQDGVSLARATIVAEISVPAARSRLLVGDSVTWDIVFPSDGIGLDEVSEGKLHERLARQ